MSIYSFSKNADENDRLYLKKKTCSSSKSSFSKGNMVNICRLYRTNVLVNSPNSNNYPNNSNPSDLEFPGCGGITMVHRQERYCFTCGKDAFNPWITIT